METSVTPGLDGFCALGAKGYAYNYNSGWDIKKLEGVTKTVVRYLTFDIDMDKYIVQKICLQKKENLYVLFSRKMRTKMENTINSKKILPFSKDRGNYMNAIDSELCI